MSTINTNGIDGNYPTPGQNNSSQGFRDNFTSIKNNLNTAGTEITELQDKAVLKQALNNITLDNNMANTLISNAAIRTFRNTTYNLGNNVSGTVVVDCTLGDVQFATITGNTTFQFAGWSPTNTKHTITLDLTVANTEAFLIFPSEVVESGDILENNTTVGGNLAIAKAPHDVTNLVYDFSTVDCGNTILVEPVNRSYQISQVEVRDAITPTGYVGDRNGDIAVAKVIEPQTVTETQATGDLMITDNTTGFYIGMPVEFTSQNGNTVFGGVSSGTDYFVTSVTLDTNFSVSATLGGANVTLTDVTSTMQVSPVQYIYHATGTYDSTATTANVQATTTTADQIEFTATVPNIASYGLNQPIVFTGNESELSAGGLEANTTYYVGTIDTSGANTKISVSRSRTNGVADANVTLTTSSTYTATLATIYTQGHDIWKRVKLDSF
jgi:hypothetical protein|tara:strand:- start:3380 stop:4699 length:1320 start_codon:yes stop_codon:yes gene_type:complete